jgi:hypothetical protein
MPRLSLSPNRHDPFWDLDGRGARRARAVRRILRFGLLVLVAIFLGLVATRLPAFDPEVLTTAGNLRPVLAVALLALLASCTLAAAARMRAGSREG